MTLDDTQFFHQATLRLCGSLDLREALEEILGFLKQFLPLRGVFLGVFDPGAQAVSLLGHAADGAPRQGDAPILLSPEAARHLSGVRQPLQQLDHSWGNPAALEVNSALKLGDIASVALLLEAPEELVGFAVFYTQGDEPLSPEQARRLELLRPPLAMALAHALGRRETRRLQKRLGQGPAPLLAALPASLGGPIIGQDGGLGRVMELARQVAPLDNHVLLLGETGVGKEVIANAIHQLSPRRGGPLIKVNSGAIPESLLDSELFGYEKGAFTGASAQQRGHFEQADRGSIFLDEIGDLTPAAQSRLLRVLETREIQRIGSSAPVMVNTRIIAATNRDLEQMVLAGEFRQDLWFRLNVFPITIPPLRRRKGDIPSLVNYFIDCKVIAMQLKNRPIPSPPAMERLLRYDWPGNVRELKTAVERELIRHQTQRPYEMLQFAEFNPAPDSGAPVSAAPPAPASLRLDEVIGNHIRYVMELTGGKVQGRDGAAAALGLHPSTLRHKMRSLGIPFGRKQP